MAMLAFIFSTGTKLLSNMTNDGNVLFSQVPTKMRHTNLLNNAITDGCVAPLTMLLTIVIMYHKILSF